jgi:hypothetical protein
VTTPPGNTTDAVPLSCARCAVELRPGTGNFYWVSIEAVADPWPPIASAEEPADLRQKIERLLAQMEGMSEQEAMDQVYRHLTFYLCGPCYRQWIASPVR